MYLDISFAFDPEVVLPVLIVPPKCAPGSQNNLVGPYPVGAFVGQYNSDFPPPAVPGVPYPAYQPPGSYGYPGVQSPSAQPSEYPVNPQMLAGPPGVYPPQPPLMYGGYSNPVPQMPSPYGSPSNVPYPPPPPPAFNLPPSAPQSQPSTSSLSPSAPASNPMPSAPVMNSDFLSQSNDAPPSHSLDFLSSKPEQSDGK